MCPPQGMIRQKYPGANRVNNYADLKAFSTTLTGFFSSFGG